MQDVLVQTVTVRLKNLSSQQGPTDSGVSQVLQKVAGLVRAVFGFTFAGVFDGPWPLVCTCAPSHQCLRAHLRGVHGRREQDCP